MDFYERVCRTAQVAPLAYMAVGVVVLSGPGAAVIQNVQAESHHLSGEIIAKVGSMGTSIHAPLNFGPMPAAGTASAYR
jgi:hypothetical protein